MLLQQVEIQSNYQYLFYIFYKHQIQNTNLIHTVRNRMASILIRCERRTEVDDIYKPGVIYLRNFQTHRSKLN